MSKLLIFVALIAVASASANYNIGNNAALDSVYSAPSVDLAYVMEVPYDAASSYGDISINGGYGGYGGYGAYGSYGNVPTVISSGYGTGGIQNVYASNLGLTQLTSQRYSNYKRRAAPVLAPAISVSGGVAPASASSSSRSSKKINNGVGINYGIGANQGVY